LGETQLFEASAVQGYERSIVSISLEYFFSIYLIDSLISVLTEITKTTRLVHWSPPVKNKTSPLSNKFKNLDPELTRFIESMGMYFESYGIPRIGGRILGLLLVAHEPLSAERIASILQVSRASISTNFRVLLTSGLAEKVTFPGDRTTYFVFPESGLEKTLTVEVQGITAMKRIVQQGLNALPSEDSARGRMQEMVDWADFLIELYQKALTDWQARS
jgi:DNA-binding transcriptional regulator GbsR (MarR family)